jgi:hypothetical protein
MRSAVISAPVGEHLSAGNYARRVATRVLGSLMGPKSACTATSSSWRTHAVS